jgi:hypothetical protein
MDGEQPRLGEKKTDALVVSVALVANDDDHNVVSRVPPCVIDPLLHRHKGVTSALLPYKEVGEV